NRLDRFFRGLRAERDGVLGAVEVEQINTPEPRTYHNVGRIAGKTRAGNAVLHDLERFDHNGREPRAVRRPEKFTMKQPIGAKDAAPAAVEFMLRAPRIVLGIGTVVLDGCAAAEIVCVEVDGDDEPGAEGARR